MGLGYFAAMVYHRKTLFADEVEIIDVSYEWSY